MNRDYLKWAALGFALVATASAEYELARAVGYNQWVAAAVPGALDVWTVRAMRQHRDVLAAVLAMIVVNALSHLVTAGLLEVSVPLVVGVSAIAPLVLYRLHAITGAEQPDTPPAAVEQADTRAEVTDEQPLEVTAPPAVERVVVATAPHTSPHVICGAGQVYEVTVPTTDTRAEVTDEQPDRLPTAAARVVLESCWAKGTPPAEAARLATRSTSYAKKVFRSLDERGAAPVPGQLALVGKGATA